MNDFTDWFPAEVTPTREGVYEVADDGGGPLDRLRWYAYWNGKRFCYRTSFDDPQQAFERRDFDTKLPALTKWRGLKEPK